MKADLESKTCRKLDVMTPGVKAAEIARHELQRAEAVQRAEQAAAVR